MNAYSVLIAWSDADDDSRTFATTVRAKSAREAEAKAREEMRATVDQQYLEGQQIGGRVLNCYEGALGVDQELEDALRGLLDALSARDTKQLSVVAWNKACAVVAALDGFSIETQTLNNAIKSSPARYLQEPPSYNGLLEFVEKIARLTTLEDEYNSDSIEGRQLRLEYETFEDYQCDISSDRCEDEFSAFQQFMREARRLLKIENA